MSWWILTLILVFVPASWILIDACFVLEGGDWASSIRTVRGLGRPAPPAPPAMPPADAAVGSVAVRIAELTSQVPSPARGAGNRFPLCFRSWR